MHNSFDSCAVKDPGSGFKAVGCGSIVGQKDVFSWVSGAFYSQPPAIHCVACFCAELTEEIEGKGYLFQKDARHCLVWKVELVEPLIATVPIVFEGESEGGLTWVWFIALSISADLPVIFMASNELSR